MQYDDFLATARGEITGESLTRSRAAVGRMEKFNRLIEEAPGVQALLESVVLEGIGFANHRGGAPFGVRAAIGEHGRLELRVEDESVIEGVLVQLPHADRRGVVRGLRGLLAQHVDRGVELTIPAARDRWRQEGDAVVVLRGSDGVHPPAVLERHEAQCVEARVKPLWTPEALADFGPVKPERRKTSTTPTFFQRHSASGRLASRVLRRPRIWDRLAGHLHVSVTCSLAEHGQDWTVSRTVSRKVPLHDDRLLEILQDQVVGPGLRLSDHACDQSLCVMRLVTDRLKADRGMVIVTTTHGTRADGSGEPGRSFAVLGERPGTTPSSRSAQSRGMGVAVQIAALSGSGSSSFLHDLAIQVGARWACEGRSVGVLHAVGDDPSFDFSRPVWPPVGLSPASPSWARLRLDHGDGQLFGLEVDVEDDQLEVLVAEAKNRFDRVLLVKDDRWERIFRPADAHVLVTEAKPFERTLLVPRRVGPPVTRQLDPSTSALRWHERTFHGSAVSRFPMAGLVVLDLEGHSGLATDEFTRLAEAELAELGTPVLAKIPARTLYRTAPPPPTALDDSESPVQTCIAGIADAIDASLASIPASAATNAS
ncbi:hypothetical protein ACIGZJ_33315 [Kitasatospora sp. NPDC052868]|uniref:hypothetical protein n=1 Tax=Kitasatospora sp. NPDC052868 TaxID=3364060 RepID=UPI0037C5D072